MKRVLINLIVRGVRIGVAVWLCILLAGGLGAWPALGVWAGGMAALCTATGLLLRRVPAGQMTWVNRVAGFVLPWGYYLGRGMLPRIVLFSWLGWVVLGATVVAVTSLNVDASPPTEPAASGEIGEGWTTVLLVLLLLAWLVDAGALMFVVGIQARHRMRMNRALMTVVGILAGLIAISAALAFLGGSRWSLLAAVVIAGGPPAAVGFVYGLFVLVVVVSGRKFRWH